MWPKTIISINNILKGCLPYLLIVNVIQLAENKWLFFTLFEKKVLISVKNCRSLMNPKQKTIYFIDGDPKWKISTLNGGTRPNPVALVKAIRQVKPFLHKTFFLFLRWMSSSLFWWTSLAFSAKHATLKISFFTF